MKERLVLLPTTGDKNHSFPRTFLHPGTDWLVDGRDAFQLGRRGWKKTAILAGEHQLGKKHACLFPPFFCQKILHIRRQSPDHMHSQIKAIGFYEFVGRYIVEVLGRGNLSGNLSRKVHSICPKEFQKTMQLIRHQERVYG